MTQSDLQQPRLASHDSLPQFPASWETIRVPDHVCLYFTDMPAQKGHRRVQVLIWLQAGEGLVLYCLGTQARHSSLCLAGETFLAQVKRETFYCSPQQSSSNNGPFSSSCVQAHMPVLRGGSKLEPLLFTAGTSACSRDSLTSKTA